MLGPPRAGCGTAAVVSPEQRGRIPSPDTADHAAFDTESHSTSQFFRPHSSGKDGPGLAQPRPPVPAGRGAAEGGLTFPPRSVPPGPAPRRPPSPAPRAEPPGRDRGEGAELGPAVAARRSCRQGRGNERHRERGASVPALVPPQHPPGSCAASQPLPPRRHLRTPHPAGKGGTAGPQLGTRDTAPATRRIEAVKGTPTKLEEKN